MLCNVPKKKKKKKKKKISSKVKPTAPAIPKPSPIQVLNGLDIVSLPGADETGSFLCDMAVDANTHSLIIKHLFKPHQSLSQSLVLNFSHSFIYIITLYSVCVYRQIAILLL